MAEVIDDTESFTIALTPMMIPAKGEIVNLNYPASVERGALFDVNASVKNVGGSTGEFKLELFVDGQSKVQSPPFTVYEGDTSGDKIPMVEAPASGTSMSIEVKCIRVA